MIPEQFLVPGNYEDDKDTLVIQREFKDKVPYDYAFARWFCINKGISIMPGTSFCLEKDDMLAYSYSNKVINHIFILLRER